MAKYRPLPDSLTIMPSKIEGLGLFTLSDISKGENLGLSHIVDLETGEIVRTPLGGFINHSDTPNAELISCAYTRDIECGVLELKALRDIGVGEEICTYYTLYNPPSKLKDIQVHGIDIISGTESASLPTCARVLSRKAERSCFVMPATFDIRSPSI